MPRIKLEVLTFYSFHTIIPIRITDINYGGHVGNDTILGLLHEARVQFLQSFDYHEMDVNGAGLIMSDVVIEFKKELFYGKSIKVSIAASDFTKVSFELYYKMETESVEKTELIALAKTGMVCFNYQNRKITRLPEDVRLKLQISGTQE
jgi:acyl-CoA thioesterase FadM